MSFLRIKDPRKRDSIVADYLTTIKNIQDQNIDERSKDLTKVEHLQKIFKPVIQTTETATNEVKNEIKKLNKTLEKNIENKEKKLINLEDILSNYAIGNPLNLDPYFSIQRTDEGYVMGDKEVTFDKSFNIHVEEVKYVIMLKKTLWEKMKI